MVFSTAYAQAPCSPGQPMANTCSAACVVCDLDGYTNSSSLGTPGQSPPGFCTFVVHTSGWVGFVAGSTDLSIDVAVGSCSVGNSIEMGIYNTPDCNTFNLISECNTEMFQSNTYSFSNTEPLTPGCTYYLVFDNNGPAVCPYTVSVTSGSATAPPIGPAAVPSGPTSVCPGATATYTVPEVFGACEYIWTIPPGSTINGMGGPVSAGNTVDVTFGSSSGQVCVRPDNDCYNVTPTCLPVAVAPLPPTILPPITTCFGQSVEWIDGNFYTGTQLLNTTLTSYLGCDSVVRQQLNMLPANTKNLPPVTICEGECFDIGGQSFCTAGNYSVVFLSEFGCDSTVFFIVNQLVVNAVATVSDTITCQQPTVSLNATGSSPGMYTWFNPQHQAIGNAILQPVSLPGSYLLLVTRIAGGVSCADSASVKVVFNGALPGVTATGDTIGCDASPAQLNGESPAQNILFTWSGPGISPANAHLENPLVDSAGVYVLMVLDTLTGCKNSDTTFVGSLGLPPVLTLSSDTITCAGPATIQVGSNVPGTIYLWTGPGGFIDSLPTISATPAGVFTVTGTTPGGCVAADSIEVVANLTQPDFTLAADTFSCTDTTAWLSATGLSLYQYNWTGPGGFMAVGDSTLAAVPGLYQVVATGTNACTAIRSVQTPINDVQPIAQATGDTITCTALNGMLQGSANTPNTLFYWTGPNSFTASGSTAIAIYAGTYTLTATGPNGCNSTATADVALNTTPPDLLVSNDTNITCARPQIGLNAMTNTPDADIAWIGPAAYTAQGNSASVQIPGAYIATATGPNGCITTDSVSVAIDTIPPDVNATGDTLDCAAVGVTLIGSSLTPGANFLWTGPGGLNTTNPAPVVSVIGVYTLAVTGPNGCTADTTAEVVADDDAPAVSIASPVAITCGQPQTTLSVTSGSTGVQYVWNGPGGLVFTDSSFTTSLPGLYTLVATAPNGCTVMATETVMLDTFTPVLQATDDALSCSKPSGVLTGSSGTPGTVLNWNGPNGFAASGNTALISLPGLYTLTGTAPNGCTAQMPVVVGADVALPDAQLSVSNVLTCTDTLTTLGVVSGTNGVTVQWSGPGTFSQNGLTAETPWPGLYTATTTAPNGCSRTDTLTVFQNVASPDASAGSGTLTCTNPTIVLTGQSNTPNASFNWTGPGGFSAQIPNPGVAFPGVYTLTVQAPNGCTASISTNISADQAAPVLQTTVTDTINCNKVLVDFSVQSSLSMTQFNWSGPGGWTASGTNQQTNIPGAFTVVGTALNGCQDTAVAVVLIDTVAPQMNSVTAGVITCAQPTALLSGSSGTFGVQYAWSGPGGFSAANPQTQTNLPGVYTLVFTGPNGCSSTRSILVPADTMMPDLQLLSNQTELTCADTVASIAAQSGATGVQFTWSGPNGFSAAGSLITVNQAGGYTATATAANGCSAQQPYFLMENIEAPDVQASDDTLDCSGNGLALSGESGTAGVSYQWSGPNGFSAMIPAPLVAQPGTYLLLVTAPNGCISVDTVNIVPPPAVPAFSATSDTITCTLASATMLVENPSPSLQFSWNGPNGFAAAGLAVQTPTPGAYTLYGETGQGCVDSLLLQVVEDVLVPTITLPDGLIPCASDSAQLRLTVSPADAQLNWSGPQGSLPADSNATWVTVPGLYTVIATGPNGCSAEAQAVVETQLPNWSLELGPDRLVREGDIVGISLVTDLPFDERQSVVWTPYVGCGPCIPQVFLADTTFLLSLAITDVDGCRITDSLLIRVIPAPKVYAPNVFSPASSDANNTFQLFAGAGVARFRSLRVYDRWGGQVFGATDFLPGDKAGQWDGRFNGSMLNPAVFIWVAEVEGLSGEVVLMEGDVTLER
jgi:hypothetical protein